jgi:hypothetical protein
LDIIKFINALNSKTMKKVLMFLFLPCFFFPQLVAQESTFSKGDKVLNIGVGIVSLLGSEYTVTFPPITGSLEFGVADNVLKKGAIGVAPFIGFGAYKYEIYNYTYIPIGVRGIFHYPLVKKLDTYAGLLFGYFIVSGNQIGSAYESRGYGSVFIGGRYYFSEKFAAMLELGADIIPLHIGVAYKF